MLITNFLVARESDFCDGINGARRKAKCRTRRGRFYLTVLKKELIRLSLNQHCACEIVHGR